MLATVINTISALVYLLSTLVILRRHTRFLPLFGFVSLMQLWSLVSCFYNDLGIYNFELFRYTSVTYATTRLALFYLVFNIGFAVVAGSLSKHVPLRRDYDLISRPVNSGSLKLVAYVMLGLVLGYALYRAAAAGVPLLHGMDRLSYLENATLVERLLLVWGTLLAFVLGVTRRKRGRWSWNGGVLTALLIYAVAVGHKFSFLSELLLAYWIPVFARWVLEKPNWHPIKLKYAIFFSLFLLVSATAAYAIYSHKLGSISEARSLLFNRALSFQGEMWWAVANQAIDGESRFRGHWLDELEYLADPSSVQPESVGMRYLMVQILGARRAQAIFEHGYLYTMAYPAILVATFPHTLALLVQLLAGAFFGGLLFYLHDAITSEHRLRATVAFLIVIPFMAMLWTGNFFVFFTFGLAMKMLFLVTLESLPRLHKALPGHVLRPGAATLTE